MAVLQARAGVVLDVVARRVEHAVVAVTRVGIERDVGDHDEFGHRFFHGADGAQHERVLVERLGALVVLQLRIELGKQRDGRHAKFVDRAALLHEVGDVQPEDARHRLDFLGAPLPIHHEKRRDEVRRPQHGFLDHGAQRGGAAQAARTLREIEFEVLSHGKVPRVEQHGTPAARRFSLVNPPASLQVPCTPPLAMRILPLIALVLVLLAGCTTGATQSEPEDPVQRVNEMWVQNRQIYYRNQGWNSLDAAYQAEQDLESGKSLPADRPPAERRTRE